VAGLHDGGVQPHTMQAAARESSRDIRSFPRFLLTAAANGSKQSTVWQHSKNCISIITKRVKLEWMTTAVSTMRTPSSACPIRILPAFHRRLDSHYQAVCTTVASGGDCTSSEHTMHDEVATTVNINPSRSTWKNKTPSTKAMSSSD
jgi:hypothetical protein